MDFDWSATHSLGVLLLDWLLERGNYENLIFEKFVENLRKKKIFLAKTGKKSRKVEMRPIGYQVELLLTQVRL